MELARNAMRSNIQDMSNKEYDAFIKKMLKEADSDAEAGKIKTMYDKIRAGKSLEKDMDSRLKGISRKGDEMYQTVKRSANARGGKIMGYAHGTPKGGVKKMSSCRGRKAMGNKD
jgi:hypothetical protein